MNKVFVILSHCSDGCTYACSDMLDSVWSSEEIALKRLYFLEEYHKNEIRNDEYRNFGYEIVELDHNHIHDVQPDRETKWLQEEK
jgi:hypothetical protein